MSTRIIDGMPLKATVMLPTDVARGPARGHVAAHCTVTWPKDLVRRLDDGRSSNDWRITVIAAFVVLLHRYTEQPSLSLGVFTHDGDAGVLRGGAITLAPEGGSTLAELARRVGEAFAALPRSPTPPECGVAITLLAGEPARRFEAGGDPPLVVRAALDVHVLLVRGSDGLGVRVDYNAALFSEASIVRFATHLGNAIDTAIGTPAITLDRVPLLGHAEREQLLTTWSSGTLPYAPEAAHVRFSAIAAARPEATAARFRGETLRYGELERRANRLAHHLRALGVEAGVTVGVCVEPSFHILVAMLAVWKAGGIYVPIDPSHPPARIAAILEDTQPLVVLTQTRLREALDLHTATGEPALCLDGEGQMFADQPATPPNVPIDLEGTAYVFYTSGTTGRPKGALATHRNLAHYITQATHKYGFSRSDVFCSVARFTFSISMFELVSPLLCGAELRLLERDHVLDPARLVETLREVTVLHAGPSLLRALLRHVRNDPGLARAFISMRHASTGGDLVPPDVMEELKLVFPHAEIYVIYGCTEVSCMGTTFQVPRDHAVGKSYVGKPFPDVAVRLVDGGGNLVPIGVVGEIHIGGKGVTRGYLGQSERTAEKYFEQDGIRFYRTGDMGRFDANGDLEMLGRRDFQIQLNGIRIELGEVETTLRRAPGVREAVVAARDNEHGERMLVAYVVPEPEHPWSSAAAREFMLARLPEYMVPSVYVTLEKLPLNHNFKVDRNALPTPGRDDLFAQREFVEPRTQAERVLAEICEELLGFGRVGIDDDFFSTGVNSLLALSLNAELQARTGVALPMSLLFGGGSIRTLAAALEQRLAQHGTGSTAAQEVRPVLLNDDGHPPLYMLLGVYIYRTFALSLEGEASVYGVYVDKEAQMVEAGAAPPQVAELAEAYIAVIRAQQPHGPYRLGGFSFGGIVAYEVAQRLVAAGERVESLLLVDAVLPRVGLDRWLGPTRRLFSLSPRQLARVVGRKASGLVDRVLERRALRFEARVYQDDRARALDELRSHAYGEAAVAYMQAIRPYRGAVSLVVSGRRLDVDPLGAPDCGWGSLVTGIEGRRIDAEHLALLEQPAVEQVSTLVRRELQRGHLEGSRAWPGRKDEPEGPHEDPAAVG